MRLSPQGVGVTLGKCVVTLKWCQMALLWVVSTDFHHIVTTAWFHGQANLWAGSFLCGLFFFLYLDPTFPSCETTGKVLITLILSFHNGK